MAYCKGHRGKNLNASLFSVSVLRLRVNTRSEIDKVKIKFDHIANIHWYQ